MREVVRYMRMSFVVVVSSVVGLVGEMLWSWFLMRCFMI